MAGNDSAELLRAGAGRVPAGAEVGEGSGAHNLGISLKLYLHHK